MSKKEIRFLISSSMSSNNTILIMSLSPGASFGTARFPRVHHGGNVKPEIILCPHENTAVGIAHGYAKVAEADADDSSQPGGAAAREHGHLLCLCRPGPRWSSAEHRSHGQCPEAPPHRLDPHRSRPGQCHPGSTSNGTINPIPSAPCPTPLPGPIALPIWTEGRHLHLLRCHHAGGTLEEEVPLLEMSERLAPQHPIQADPVAPGEGRTAPREG